MSCFYAMENDRIIWVLPFDWLVARGNLEHICEYTAWCEQVFLDNCEDLAFHLIATIVINNVFHYAEMIHTRKHTDSKFHTEWNVCSWSGHGRLFILDVDCVICYVLLKLNASVVENIEVGHHKKDSWKGTGPDTIGGKRANCVVYIQIDGLVMCLRVLVLQLWWINGERHLASARSFQSRKLVENINSIRILTTCPDHITPC